MVNVPSVQLNDGNKMPQVGFGLWKVDNATCADQVYEAIKTGYRLFDGACGTCIQFEADRTFWSMLHNRVDVASRRISRFGH